MPSLDPDRRTKYLDCDCRRCPCLRIRQTFGPERGCEGREPHQFAEPRWQKSDAIKSRPTSNTRAFARSMRTSIPSSTEFTRVNVRSPKLLKKIGYDESPTDCHSQHRDHRPP